MSDKLTLQEQAARYQAMVAKRTEAQRKRRAKKRAEGMREVTAWVREMMPEHEDEYIPVLVWMYKPTVQDYQAKQANGLVPYLKTDGGAQVLAWAKPKNP